MDETTARIILYAITAAGVVVWFAGLRFVNAACRVRRVARNSTAERFELTAPPAENLVFGSVELQGEPATLLPKLTSILVKENAGPVGQLKITQQTENLVAFEGTGPEAADGQSGQYVRRGQLRFSRLADRRTCVDYAVEVCGGRGLLLGAVALLILGVTALVVGFVVINTYVVPHQDPNVRGQTFQMLQVVHFLWPPFLLGARYRRRYSTVQARFDTLIHNLPYYEP